MALVRKPFRFLIELVQFDADELIDAFHCAFDEVELVFVLVQREVINDLHQGREFWH